MAMDRLISLDLSALGIIKALALCFVIHFVILVLYRLQFSPLAEVPGPRFAAASLWYEFYYDVIKRGSYIWKIQEMHKQYGAS